MLLESDSRAQLIPAHIWTPWFSALGEHSGFDSIDECYRDLAPHVHAIETGLSSNPPMNWALACLDRFAIISNSDAHSPNRLGREATIFEMEPSYSALTKALSGSPATGLASGRVEDLAGTGRTTETAPSILETVEFFPQEGKYHHDGHRKCGFFRSPAEGVAAGSPCPVCGKPLTPGVLGRVMQLADRPVDENAPCPPQTTERGNRRPYRSLIPLTELLGEILGVGTASKKVARAYAALVEKAGGEFAVLMEHSPADLARLDCPGVSGELLSVAVDRMRRGEVSITPGYDGKYGVVRALPVRAGSRSGVRG
jgi:PHP family Zn ribbon phosphoesterase